MNNRALLALSLAPLLGASQNLLQATTIAALSLLGLSLHRLCMTPWRQDPLMPDPRWRPNWS